MIRPKKSLGQHFLHDENIARKIMAAIPEEPHHIVEIGPGTGMLTKYILRNRHWESWFIETDAEAVEYLRDIFPDFSGKIIYDDFLKTNLNQYVQVPFQVVGNFPYNISSQIFFRILEYKDKVRSVVCMLQKEVAQRIAAPHGNKTYGILSVLLQTYYTTEYLFTVPEQVFTPPPKVKSGVMRLTRFERPVLPINEAGYHAFVKTAFNQRRKTLRNALKPLGKDLSVIPAHILDKRAEQLEVEEFIRYSNAIFGPL